MGDDKVEGEEEEEEVVEVEEEEIWEGQYTSSRGPNLDSSWDSSDRLGSGGGWKG